MTCSRCGSPHAETTEFCTTCGTTLVAPPASDDATPASANTFDEVDLVGQIVDGKYLVEATLASTSRVMVYRASRLGVGGDVLLKVLRGRWVVVDPGIVERFRREVQAIAHLQHPNVAAMHDSGFSADGLLYTVSEMIEGQSIRARIDGSGSVPAADAVEITRQVASALDEAHRCNIIHRNLKPENVFVDGSGADLRVKVVDFGLATLRNVALAVKGSSASRAGGTDAAYLPPELSWGEEPDARSDVYGLGLLAHEMLTGVPLGAAKVTPLKASVEAVLRRALEPKRADRPPSTGAFAHLLAAAVDEKQSEPEVEVQTATQPVLPMFTTTASPRLRIAPMFVAAVAIIVMFGLSVGALAFHFAGSKTKQLILAEINRGNLAKATGASAYDLFQKSKDGDLSAAEKAEIAATAAAALEKRGEQILDRLKTNSRESEDDWEEAVRVYGWLNEMRPDAKFEARIRFAEARLNFMRREYDLAAVNFQRSVDAEPTWALALNGLGRTKARLGDVGGAIACYRRATESDPAWIYPWLNLAVASIGAKDYTTAEVALRHGLEIYPARSTTRFALGRTLERTGRACEAMAEYRIALEHSKEGERPIFNPEALQKKIERLAASAHCS
jgi:tetratricopeptide (TPR) repeat protein